MDLATEPNPDDLAFDLDPTEWGDDGSRDDRPMFPAPILQLRQAAWRDGPAVILSDGRTWHLPQLDVPLILADAELAGQVDAFIAAPPVATVPPEQFYNQFGSLLHAIGYRMLRANYVLAPADGFALVMFFNPDGSLDFDRTTAFLVVVAQQVAAIAPRWLAISAALRSKIHGGYFGEGARC